MTTLADALSLSPRLAWLKKHRLHTAQDELPRCPGPYNEKPWRCSNGARTINVWGDSEDEVIWGWCRMHNVDHYDAAGWVMAEGAGNLRTEAILACLPSNALLPGMTVATSEICDE